MKILITGNLGYVGAHLCRYLRRQYPKAILEGYDIGYFQNHITSRYAAPESLLDVQHIGDVRNFDDALLSGVDYVVHLAAISNDPIGNSFENITMDVNYKATVDIARKAAFHGVKNFVFASSCSVYGAAGEEARTEHSPVNPLTAYAKSKVLAEQGLFTLSESEMVITCLRFATACGMSDRLRLDLVLNDFVASAIATGSINILSDGAPWRPLINVKDMARAIDWAMQRSHLQGGKFLICNAGSNDWNFTVKELANHVQQIVHNTTVQVNESAPPDKRSYRVNFSCFNELAKGYTPLYSISETISELRRGLTAMKFSDMNFRKGELIRLNVLTNLIETGKVDNDLRWIFKTEPVALTA